MCCFFMACLLYPSALASKHVNASIGSESDPLANGAKHAADGLDFLESPREELARFGKVGGGVVGHEELGGAVHHGEGGALGVP